VNIFRIENDTLKQLCSGSFVSRNYVLTDCHCIGEYDSTHRFNFYDSLYVYPVFDKGNENSFFGKSRAIGYATFSINMFLMTNPFKDIALVKLEDSLGSKTGRLGIAFNENDDFLEGAILHNLSYPGTVDRTDLTRVYNGDTLYYNYGNHDIIQRKSLGYRITGIEGQSGSSLFYTGNEEYYSFGTQVWAGNSSHIRIDRQIFYSLNQLLPMKLRLLHLLRKVWTTFIYRKHFLIHLIPLQILFTQFRQQPRLA